MHSWNQAFTTATKWQYKHQIAYWKAKAKALQCENQVLHDIIRRRYNGSSTSELSESENTSDVESDNDEVNDDYNNSEEKEPQLEVSEAFIEFLAANAKFKEDAKQERERQRRYSSSETEAECIKRLEQPPSQVVENNAELLKELYGNEWQKISALEMSLQSKFMSDCDRLKPAYWPNIPFNFNFK